MHRPFFKNENKVNDQDEQNQQGEKSNNDRFEEAFLYTINEKRKEDPLIGAKIGAKEMINNIINRMKDSRGIHIESLICVLGSLAGYSCQASLRKEFIEGKGLKENQVFTIVETRNGNIYYFGDLINKPLVENQLSVWSLAAGAVQQLGIGKMIDIHEVFKYVSSTVGCDSYGIPRIPEGHKPGDIPYNYVRYLWPVFLPMAEKYCAAPNEWPIMFGLAVQKGIILGKEAIDPLFALSIAMESAIPMAKADIKLDK